MDYVDYILEFMNSQVGILKSDMFTSQAQIKKRKNWVKYKQKRKGIYGEREEQVGRIIHKIFGIIPFVKVRPDFLRYKNGKNLELDFYSEDLKIAIEIQGRGHYEFIEKFHRDMDDFNECKRRDQFKRDMCSALGIKLIEVPYYIALDNVKDYIIKRI